MTIDRTTVLRAIATRDDYLSTNVDTQTYLFLDDIVDNQTEMSVLAEGYPDSWNADNGDYTADYGLDPDVVGTFDANGNHWERGDLFGGVYANRSETICWRSPRSRSCWIRRHVQEGPRVRAEESTSIPVEAAICYRSGQPRWNGSRPTVRPNCRSTAGIQMQGGDIPSPIT